MRLRTGNIAGVVLFVTITVSAAFTTILLGAPQAAPPQPRRREIVPTASLETYAQVLDLVFPAAKQSRKDSVFSIVVRYIPSFGPESQITVRQVQGRGGDVEFITADQNVWAIINGVLRDGHEIRPEVLARAVRVQRRIFNLSADRSFAIQTGLFAGLNETMSGLRSAGLEVQRTRETTIVLDGESYELRYKQGMTTFSSYFSASEADLTATPNATSLGKWARSLRDEMEHLAEGVRPGPLR